jgi:hypothetical protein
MTPRLQEYPAEGAREVIDRELTRVDRKVSDEHGSEQAIGANDVQRLLGDLDAAKVADILALQPSLAELEEAAAWVAGEGDVPAQEGHPLVGNAAAIFDIAEAQQDDADR